MSENIEKRLHNIETAIVGLVALLEYEVPPDAGDALRRLAEDFYDAQQSLGAPELPRDGSPFTHGE